MLLRCGSPKHVAYANYGGRGITVCDRWKTSVANFIEDMGPRPSPLHELDRIDNNKGYEPANCRWLDRRGQARNRRSNRLLTINGQTRTVAEWAEISGTPATVISKRLSANWPDEVAVFKLVREKAKKGDAKVLHGTCIDCGKSGVFGTRCKSCENRRRHREKVGL